MATYNTDILPNTTGQNLGSPDQQWHGFFDTLTVETLIEDGVPVVTGDATSLQGTPICTTVPTTGQILLFGTNWCPSSTINATELQGNPISTGAPAPTQALIWNGAQWAPANQSGGGGGGATLGYVAVGFSATPVFTPSPVGACAFEMTLTGNVTSSTFTTAGLTAGALMTFIFVQDSSGGHSFVYPSTFRGQNSVSVNPFDTTAQQFLFNGTLFKAIALAVTY